MRSLQESFLEGNARYCIICALVRLQARTWLQGLTLERAW